MPRGGYRPNSGRLPLWRHPRTVWIVACYRQELERAAPALRARRLRGKHPAFDELEQKQARLRALSVAERRRALQRPEESPDLEDVRFMLDGDEDTLPQIPRFVPAVKFSKQFLHTVQCRVARRASAKFGEAVTLRQVQRALQGWRRFEEQMRESLRDPV